MSTPLESIYTCPDCNAVAAVPLFPFDLWQCSCGKLLRIENGKVTVSQLLPLIHSNDLLQPGCTGVWKTQPFTITGRVRVWFEDKVINYWTLLFDDKTVKWLCEGYGLYAVLETNNSIKKIASGQLSKIGIGNKHVLQGNHEYQLIKKEKSWNLEAEGKISLPIQSTTLKSFEFAAENGSCVTLLQGDPEELFYFQVFNVHAADLSLQGLRNQAAATPHHFQCTECSEKIEVITFPYALSCACKKCGTGYHYLPHTGFKKIHTRKDDFTPQFILGETGVLNGIKWQILGYAQKQEDNSYHSRWREYTLYNSSQGFAFLSEFDGHWTFLKERNQCPVLMSERTGGFNYSNESFSIYNKYRHTIISAAGEFPYDIYTKKDVEAKEFISPPEIWIREKGNKEGITWFFGHHVRRAELKKTFPLEYELPAKSGIGAVQPTGYINPVKTGIVAFCAILVFIVLHGIASLFNENKVVFEGPLLFDSTNTATAVAPPLQLNKYSSNLKLILSAPVVNSWVEVSATLVNTSTGKEYSLEQGVEYYYGFSEGESWSEGSTSSETYFTAIPSGTYRLQLRANKSYEASNLTDVSVKAVYSVESSRNLFAAVIIIIIAAAGTFYVTQIFEKQRWQNSPFSVYTNE